MSSYILSCCSTVDLNPQVLDKNDIKYIYFNYQLNGQQCKDDFGKTHSPHDLYSQMLAGATATTSQVSTGEYIEYMRPYLEAGLDVLHVTLSSGISGTYNAACAARDLLKEEFPHRKIYVVDSLCASAGYGLLMLKLAELKNAGMTIDELAAWAEAHRLEVQHWFFSTDLTFFVRGGRISKAAGAVGGLLRICPVMHVDAAGTLQVKEKVRTKARASKRVVDIMTELAQDGLQYAGPVLFSQSECRQDALACAEQIVATFPRQSEPADIFDIGATIGAHTGPGTVALFYWGTSRSSE